jgi:hypothetical protein
MTTNQQLTTEQKAEAGWPRGRMYRVQNPFTGATEYLARAQGPLAAWAVFYRNADGHVRHLGWSNADTAERAAAQVAEYSLGTDYTAVAVHEVSHAEARTQRERRAQLAPTDTERQRWAARLTEAGIDYLRAGDDVEATRAREHLTALSERIVRQTGEQHRPRGWYTGQARRIFTRADVAARHFLIVERALDSRSQLEAIEHHLAEYLRRRDELIHALEVIVPW